MMYKILKEFYKLYFDKKVYVQACPTLVIDNYLSLSLYDLLFSFSYVLDRYKVMPKHLWPVEVIRFLVNLHFCSCGSKVV